MFLSSFALYSQPPLDIPLFPGEPVAVSIIPSSTIPTLITGSTISVTFVDGPGTDVDCPDDWTFEMKKAFLRGVTEWENTLRSPVPIRIRAELTNGLGGAIASATPLFESNFPNAPMPNVQFPRPLADMLAGYDISPGEPDIFIQVLTNCGVNKLDNEEQSWNFGFGSVENDEFSFITAVLHEIGHGFLGRSTTRLVNISGDYLGVTSSVNIMDFFLRDCDSGLSAQDLIDDPGNGINNFSIELGDFLQGDNICWSAPPGFPSTCLDELEELPRMYAPSFPPLNQSELNNFSHMDEASYPPGDANALMTPFLSPGEATLQIGELFKCMLESMGWLLAIPEAEPDDSEVGRMGSGNTYNTFVGLKIEPNPAVDEVLINLSERNEGLIEIVNLSGKTVLTANKQEDQFKILMNVSSLPVGIYFANFLSNDKEQLFIEKFIIQH